MDIDNDHNIIYLKKKKFEKIEFIERKIHILDYKMNEINLKLDSLYDNFLIIIENQNKIINNVFKN